MVQKRKKHFRLCVYGYKDHGVSANDIPGYVLDVISKLRSAGHTTYLVGGSVRDLLRKIKPKDFDIATTAPPQTILRLFDHSKIIGKRFPIVIVPTNKHFIEVTTFRGGDEHSPQWGKPEEDVLRRDFTVNGLFFNPLNDQILDYVGGYKDLLTSKSIVCIASPEDSFTADPVRILRLFKLCASTTLSIRQPETVAILKYKHVLKSSTGARIYDMLSKMLQSGHAYEFFKLLFSYNIIEIIVPNAIKIHHCPYIEMSKQHLIPLITKAIDLHTQNEGIRSPYDNGHKERLFGYWLALMFEIACKQHGNIVDSFLKAIGWILENSTIAIPKKVIYFAAELISGVQILHKARKSGKQLSTKNRKWIKDVLEMWQIKSYIDPSCIPDKIYWYNIARMQNTPSTRDSHTTFSVRHSRKYVNKHKKRNNY